MTEPEPSKSDLLAQRRTALAGTRTALAAERTLMAWVRTALSLISFGFTIYKFLEALVEAEKVHFGNPNGPRNLGIFLILVGTASLLAGMVEYRLTLRRIEGGRPAQIGFTFYLACAVALLGLVLLAGILIQIGPF